MARMATVVLGLQIAAFPATSAAAASQELQHLDCAGNYAALSIALPYLPGIILMFKIAPRSGYAQRMYIIEAKPISKRAVRDEAERRKTLIMAALEAGETTLGELVATAHACDAMYGLEPVPVTLDDMLKPE